MATATTLSATTNARAGTPATLTSVWGLAQGPHILRFDLIRGNQNITIELTQAELDKLVATSKLHACDVPRK